MKYQIGPYQIYSIETGRFGLDGGAMFGVVPKTLWSKTNPADELNRIELALRTLLLVSPDKKILVDTGIGQKWEDKYNQMYKIKHDQINLESSLAKVGYKTEDITDVILTHCHFDHAGGATRLDGKEIIPTFPKANYYVQERNWVWANQPTEKDQASYLKENFVPLREHHCLEFFEGPEKAFPCIEFIISEGHTTGLQLVKVTDGKETVVYCADLVPTSSHIPVPWVMGYDLRPLQTMEEKRTLLTQAVAENWTLFFEHDPYHDGAKVVPDGKGGFKPGQPIDFH